ncbi:hypothetical protein [Halalkalicoccus subterraneus]|uniref:hypothetical protein n=1 Tax=Halalkalicoccus subterraneus TaxID=2675002 RepID=UPI001B8645A5|nr:hypothetical protein [Halalkalicoccus subterraneus]
MIGSSVPLGEAVLQASADQEAIVSAVFVFLVSLLVGTVAIRLGAQVMIDSDIGFRRAIITAVIGAIVYTAVGLFLGWIPFLGPLLMLIAWVGVINWQYPGGWGTAIGIGLVAWIVAVAILFGLSTLGVVTPDAFGVPGV